MSIDTHNPRYAALDTMPMPVVPAVPQPEVYPAPAAEPLRSHKVLRKIGAAVAGAGVFASSYLVTKEFTDHGDSTAPSLEMSAGEQYELPITESIPKSHLSGDIGRVDNDLRRALSVDTCETKVTPHEALGMYERLFGTDSAPAVKPEELMMQAQDSLSQLAEAGKHFTFAKISPEEYSRLQSDAVAKVPQIPLSEYRKAVDDYMSQLGIKTLYTWNPGESGAPDAGMIRPVDNMATQTDIMARRAMVDAIGGFMNVSRELLLESGAKRIVFGDITGDSDLGEVRMGESDILVDTAIFKDNDINNMNANTNIMQVTDTHENTHLLHYSLCWQLMAHSVGQDNAMRSLNAGVVYSDDLKSKTEPTRIITLATDEGGRIIAARPYGMTNSMEDTATEGEIAFSAQNAHELFDHDDNPTQDVVPVREKFALLLARMEKKNPAVAEYYVDLLQAGRVEAFVDSEVYPVWDEMNKIYANTPDFTKLPSDNPIIQNYIRLENQVQPYVGIKNLFDASLHHSPVPLK